jgi:hypothetical protein|tara:strand:+ start:128 stop:340 length:213 start_codon:yes stop_codon:yes gene_type:complete
MFVIVLLILVVGFSSALLFKVVMNDESAARALLSTFALLSVPLLALCIALEKMNFRVNELEKKLGARDEE